MNKPPYSLFTRVGPVLGYAPMSKFLDPDFPFSPRRMPFYYGWLILPVAILGIVASIPGQTAGFSAFTEPLLKLSGLSRLQLSCCYFVGTFASGLLLPRAGKLLDSWGIRPMAVLTCLGLACTLLIMSRVDHLVAATLGRCCSPRVAYAFILTLGILGLRFFGQGMLPIISNTLIGRWFITRRGRAVALMSVCNGVVFSLSPFILYKLVDQVGWTNAWVGLALAIGVGATLVFWLVHRESPEACGIPADGSTSDTPAEVMTGVTAEAAMRTRAFWACLLPPAAIGMIMTAVTFHIVAYGSEVGVSVEKALTVFLPISAISIPTGFLSSWMSQRIGMVRLLQLMSVAQLVGTVSLQHLGSPLGYVLSALGLGVASGLFGPIQTIGLPEYFGRLHLGAINGRFYACCVLASALGPALFAGVQHLSGSFFVALYICLSLPLTGLLLTIGLRR
ncbi:MAG: OFA family oxalate/formate antiporter-like MFS transporter [Verrucomicrobiales bacterium]|jgi:OFA family oxalate/formate antiporter-like MFS transporter